MGMVKATDGPDWAVVCVDLEVDATLKVSGQVAVADCQRMAWDAAGGTDGGRWMVGPGAEPAPGPSIATTVAPAIGRKAESLTVP